MDDELTISSLPLFYIIHAVVEGIAMLVELIRENLPFTKVS